MKKYDINTVIAYVNGDDIEGFDIEELENDYHFMLEVILYTNDKKMYKSCSHDVKCNFNFVKLLINRYKEDVDFICDVADYYLNQFDKDEVEIEKNEIIVMVYNILEAKRFLYESKYMEYNLLIEGVYHKEMFLIEFSKLQNPEISDDDIEKGFSLIQLKYSESKLMLDFFAREIITREIIEENNIDLEKLVHISFSTYDEFEKYGVVKYFANVISQYDASLGDYILRSESLLTYFRKKADVIRKKWDEYNEYFLNERYTTMFYILDFCIGNDNEDMMVVCYVANELGILNNFVKYGYVMDQDEANMLVKEALEKKAEAPFDFFSMCNKIKKIIFDVLNSADYNEAINKYLYPDDNSSKGSGRRK